MLGLGDREGQVLENKRAQATPFFTFKFFLSSDAQKQRSFRTSLPKGESELELESSLRVDCCASSDEPLHKLTLVHRKG
jgi:hypothetical protein